MFYCKTRNKMNLHKQKTKLHELEKVAMIYTARSEFLRKTKKN